MSTDKKKFLSVDDLSDGELHRLFFRARSNGFGNHNKRILVTAFFEASTRTRISFEIAAYRLNMSVSTFDSSSSSMSKGEDLVETIGNLLAMGPDALVVRQSISLDPAVLGHSSSVLINGGDGVNEHPTQALTDCYTLLDRFKTDDLSGKKILIIGDIANSRVAHSNIKLMTRLGAQVVLLSPEPFRLETDLGQSGEIFSFDNADFDTDVIMCLRIQRERIKGAVALSDEEFFHGYGLTLNRLGRFKDSCHILHPGPINFGVEMEQKIAFDPRALIRDQVRNGVLVRMALLDYLLS